MLIEVNETIYLDLFSVLIFMIAVGLNVQVVIMLDTFSADDQKMHKSHFLGKKQLKTNSLTPTSG